MTTTVPHIDKNPDAACDAVANEISRTDGEASLPLAFNGAVFAGLAFLPDKTLPAATEVFGGLAVLALGTAVALLLLDDRLRLRRAGWASVPQWSRLDERKIQACLGQDARAARIRVLSVLVVGKCTRLRHAVNCTLPSLSFLALAALGTLL
jgi:hypothetical protein